MGYYLWPLSGAAMIGLAAVLAAAGINAILAADMAERMRYLMFAFGALLAAAAFITMVGALVPFWAGTLILVLGVVCTIMAFGASVGQRAQ